MSDLKTTKDALVASLFELSKAAEVAASVSVGFYKKTTTEEALAASLHNVSEAHEAVADAASKLSPKAKKAAATGKKAKNEEKAIAKEAIEKENGSIDAPEGKEKKKRKKVEKDPNAPKKPLTMYFAYLFHHRDLIREDRKKNELPPLSATEITDIVKKQWESVTDDEKNKWQKKYQDELKDYQVKKEAYNATKVEDSGKLPSAGATLPSQGSPATTAIVEEATTGAEVEVPVVAPVKESKKESKKRSKDTDEASTTKKEKKSKKSKKEKAEK